MGFTFKGDYNELKGLGATDAQITAWGNQALDTLWTQLKASGYKGTRTDMVNAMSINSKGEFMASLVPITIEGIGLQIDLLGLSSDKVTAALKTLASKSGGRVPTKASVNAVLGNSAANPSWIEAVKSTATATVSDVVTGVQKVGDAVVATGKVATWLLPAIPVVILLGLYIRSSGQKPGDFVSDVRKGAKSLAKRLGNRTSGS